MASVERATRRGKIRTDGRCSCTFMVWVCFAPTLLMVDVVGAVFAPVDKDALKAAVGTCSCTNANTNESHCQTFCSQHNNISSCNSLQSTCHWAPSYGTQYKMQNREPGEKTKIKDQAQRDAPVLAEKRNPTVFVIAENLSWLENLALDPATNSLFMSELKLGRVWRVNGSYHKEIWLSNFTDILGLTINPNKPGVLYGVGKQTGANVVFRTSTTTPETCVTITQLPKGKLGNGFGVHHESGFLFASSEGNFLPGGGSLFSIDPNTGNVTTISNRLWGADGLWIDQQRHLLYVGQVTNSKMLVWHLTLSNHSNPATSLGSMSTGGLGALAFMDDFTLGRNGSSIVAASWRQSEILEFPAYRTNKSFPLTVLVGGNSTVHPTSARWGESLDPKSSFPSSALFVTEGHAKDYLNPLKDHTSRLLRIDFPSAEEY